MTECIWVCVGACLFLFPSVDLSLKVWRQPRPADEIRLSVAGASYRATNLSNGLDLPRRVTSMLDAWSVRAVFCCPSYRRPFLPLPYHHTLSLLASPVDIKTQTPTTSRLRHNHRNTHHPNQTPATHFNFRHLSIPQNAPSPHLLHPHRPRPRPLHRPNNLDSPHR